MILTDEYKTENIQIFYDEKQYLLLRRGNNDQFVVDVVVDVVRCCFALGAYMTTNWYVICLFVYL